MRTFQIKVMYLTDHVPIPLPPHTLQCNTCPFFAAPHSLTNTVWVCFVNVE